MVATHRPATLAEALFLRAAGAVPFGGGTDLMGRLRRGAGALPAFDRPVLFLDRCAGLRGLRADGACVVIGAMTTLEEISRDPLAHPALRAAVLQMGGPALRTVATIGGNVCNASPAGDTLPFLYAFDAKVRAACPGGERDVPIADFITGPGRTTLRPDEILTALVVPAWSPAVALWRKVGTRRANALTKVSVAAFADARGPGRRVRIALGAVGPVVVRLPGAEALLSAARRGDDPADLAARCADVARAAVHPIDDQRSTASYRRETAARLVGAFAREVLGTKARPGAAAGVPPRPPTKG